MLIHGVMNNMKDYNEVFKLIKDGEWDLTDFAKWLDEFDKLSYNEGYQDRGVL